MWEFKKTFSTLSKRQLHSHIDLDCNSAAMNVSSPSNVNNSSSLTCALWSLQSLEGSGLTPRQYCDLCDPDNHWCGQYGPLRIFEIVFLCLVTTVGSFGNLLVICSVNYAGRLYKHGNVFVVNLAIVDFVVRGLCSFVLSFY